MNTDDILEVTITHNFVDPDGSEIKALWVKRWVALDFGRKGPDPKWSSEQKQGACRAVNLFQRMADQGAAVIAAYKGATGNRSDRLLGLVEPKTEFTRHNGLLCLPLTHVKEIDSSKSFLGNLPPRQCTVQLCRERSKGRLAALVLGKPLPRSVWSLHNQDVEWLVTNFLIIEGMCKCVWSGARAFEAIDHAGQTPAGRELIAQTTVSKVLVRKKAGPLRTLAHEKRDLHFFGPKDACAECLPGIEYHAIEDVFSRLDALPEGKWLIDRMLNAFQQEARQDSRDANPDAITPRAKDKAEGPVIFE